MTETQRADVSLSNASDSVHAFEALTTVKKLGLSLRQDQEIVISMCTEIATYKHKIKKMAKDLDDKEQEIETLNSKLKEITLSLEKKQIEKEWLKDAGTQCEISYADSETQTDETERGQNDGEENKLILTKEGSDEMDNDIEEKLTTQNASTQWEMSSVEVETQSEQYEMVDAEVQTEKKSRKSTGINTDEIIKTDAAKWIVDTNEVENNHEEYDTMKHSIGQRNLRLSISTQTECSNDLSDEFKGLPPINRSSTGILNSRQSASSTASRYHKRCLPQKQKGKTWIF